MPVKWWNCLDIWWHRRCWTLTAKCCCQTCMYQQPLQTQWKASTMGQKHSMIHWKTDASAMTLNHWSGSDVMSNFFEFGTPSFLWNRWRQTLQCWYVGGPWRVLANKRWFHGSVHGCMVQSDSHCSASILYIQFCRWLPCCTIHYLFNFDDDSLLITKLKNNTCQLNYRYRC